MLCSERDFDVCSCDCHTNKGVRHIAPCCKWCQKCKKNIKRSHMKDHDERCKSQEVKPSP